MFNYLLSTSESERLCFVPLDLPGFGSNALESTSLEGLAEFVLKKCRELGAKTLLAHSVASIIASLAAERSDGDIRKIVSLEGNLTAEDAYFSGTAANFDNAAEFRNSFLERLSANERDATISGYQRRVKQADPEALWELGCDARRFSTDCSPGDLLARSAHILYLHNPENCPSASLRWLSSSSMRNIVLEGASHWPTIDQPEKVATLVEDFLMA